MDKNLVKTQSEIAQKIVGSLQARVSPTAKQGNNSIVLLDCSSSMDTFTDGGIRRIDALQTALKAITANRNVKFRLFEFNNKVFEARVDDCFIPSGGTRLAEALEVMADHKPSTLTIITDGEPDNPSAALAAAEQLNCTINTIFVGDPYNIEAIEFCKSLALLRNGQFASNPLEAQTLALLPKTLNLMLTDGRPGPIAL